MKDLFSLEGKVAIVTGGNGGIGLGISRGFASAGCNLAVVARNQVKTEKAVQEIKDEFGVRVLGFKADLRYEDQIHSITRKIIDELGGIHILVNNAGANIRRLPQDYDMSEWDQVIHINLRSPFVFCRAAYPALKEAGGGKIINIGSMTSIFGGGKLAPYGTSKGGILQLTRSLAVAWARDNIQVNAILPGWIDTELTRQAKKELPGLNEQVLSRTPAGRWGEPFDIAGTAIYLASRASDFLTGVALPVDGGFSIMLI